MPASSAASAAYAACRGSECTNDSVRDDDARRGPKGQRKPSPRLQSSGNQKPSDVAASACRSADVVRGAINAQAAVVADQRQASTRCSHSPRAL